MTDIVSEFPTPKFGMDEVNLLDFSIRSVILKEKCIEIVVRNQDGSSEHQLQVPLREHDVFTFSIGSDLPNRMCNLVEQICKTKEQVRTYCNEGTTLFVSGIDVSGDLLWSVMTENKFVHHLTYEDAMSQLSKIVPNFDPTGYFEHEVDGITVARCWYKLVDWDFSQDFSL
jgi:hypothetical protein